LNRQLHGNKRSTLDTILSTRLERGGRRALLGKRKSEMRTGGKRTLAPLERPDRATHKNSRVQILSKRGNQLRKENVRPTENLE